MRHRCQKASLQRGHPAEETLAVPGGKQGTATRTEHIAGQIKIGRNTRWQPGLQAFKTETDQGGQQGGYERG